MTPEEYMDKLEAFIQKKTSQVLQLHNQYQISEFFRRDAGYYSKQTNRSPGRRAAGDKEKQ